MQNNSIKPLDLIKRNESVTKEKKEDVKHHGMDESEDGEGPTSELESEP